MNEFNEQSKFDNYYLNLTKPEDAQPQEVQPQAVQPQEEQQLQEALWQPLPAQEAQPQEARPQEAQAQATQPQNYLPPGFTPAYALVGEQRKSRRSASPRRALLVTLVLLGILLSSGLGFAGGLVAGNLNQQEQPALAQNKAPALVENPGTVTSMRDLYESARVGQAATAAPKTGLSTEQVAALTADSVVEITTETEVQVSGFGFWGRGSADTFSVPAAGSGVILSANGHIITNNHVIDGANKIEVTLRNGQSYTASLVATDAKTDVAVLKIEASGLTPALLGDSSSLVVGEPAVVIGNPLGQLGGTVTSGIISALDRSVSFREDDGTTKTMNLLQTDASINSGNSGGGLFNQYGELVGIVVAKSSGVSVEGLGFAIPINDVSNVIDDLIAYGYARGRIALGLTLITIPDQQTAASYNVEAPGVYIFRVEAGNNAERAGLQPGDRLVSVNGQELKDAGEVSGIVQQLSVGDTLTVVYERNGERSSIDIVMQETVPAETAATKTRG